jgi:hypothetical protein
MGITLETLIEGCPSWGYLLILIAAFGGAVYIAGWGLSLLGSLLWKRADKPSSL